MNRSKLAAGGEMIQKRCSRSKFDEGVLESFCLPGVTLA